MYYKITKEGLKTVNMFPAYVILTFFADKKKKEKIGWVALDVGPDFDLETDRSDFFIYFDAIDGDIAYAAEAMYSLPEDDRKYLFGEYSVFVRSLYVEEKHRKKGYAREIMEKLPEILTTEVFSKKSSEVPIVLFFLGIPDKLPDGKENISQEDFTKFLNSLSCYNEIESDIYKHVYYF